MLCFAVQYGQLTWHSTVRPLSRPEDPPGYLPRARQAGRLWKLLAAKRPVARAHPPLRKLVDDGLVRSSGEVDQEVFEAPVS